jgi:hypothetical protein
MTWSTVDGMFLAVVGLWCHYQGARKPVKLFGIFLLGSALLMKQVFLPLILIPFVFHRINRLLALLMGLLPIGIYLFYIVWAGAWEDLCTQLSARSEWKETGVLSYGTAPFLWIGFGVGLVLIFSIRRIKKLNSWWIAYLLLGCECFTFFKTEWILPGSFFFFGCTVICFFYALFNKSYQDAAVLGIILLVSWCASISIGYNFPVLCSGLLMFATWHYLRKVEVEVTPKWIHYLSVTILVVFVGAFIHLRYTHIYRDRPAAELVYPLEGVLPGGRFIYSNPNTFAYLSELKAHVEQARAAQKRYAIIPDFPGYWVAAKEPNPIFTDWASWHETPDGVMDRYIASIAQYQDQLWVIVENYDPRNLATDLVPIPKDYKTIRFISENGNVVKEGKYFTVYELKKKAIPF